jgi:hypothetical protein
LLDGFEKDQNQTDTEINNKDGTKTTLRTEIKKNEDGSLTKKTTNILHFPDGTYKIKQHR